MRRAAHEEFVCEVVYELADWDHLEVSVKVWYGSAAGKVPYNREAFWLIDLQMTIMSVYMCFYKCHNKQTTSYTALRNCTPQLKFFKCLQLSMNWNSVERKAFFFNGTLAHMASSNPSKIMGVFPWHNPCGRTMVLESVGTLTDMRNTNISWGEGGIKAASALGWLYHRPVKTVLKSRYLNLLEWNPQGLYKVCLTFLHPLNLKLWSS